MGKKAKATNQPDLRQVEEWKNKYLRALADYTNLENRVEESGKTIRQKANRDLILRLLDIVDSLNTAEIFHKDPGLMLVRDQFMKILTEEGVTEMDLVGKPYDPYSAECIEVVLGDTDNIVSEVMQRGYMQNDHVLRPAKVKVTRRKPSHPEHSEGSH